MADVDKLVAEALKSGEWKEEIKAGGKPWYWRKRDKKRVKNKQELAAVLQQEATAGLPPPPAAPPSTGAPPAPPSTAGASQIDVSAAPELKGPDVLLMEKMGMLGTDLEAMTDVQELKNQVKLWEAKYKVLLDENRRLLTGTHSQVGPGHGTPAAGTVVPSDLQLKYDALVRQNAALLAELEVKTTDVRRLQRAVEDLSDHKAKLEVQLGEAYAQASEGLEAKQKLSEKDDVAKRVSEFVNVHYQEQNKFLAAQVAELTSLLHKLKEEDNRVALLNAAEESVPPIHLPPEERGVLAVHFSSIINSPARHVLCSRCKAAVTRMVSSENIEDRMQVLHAPIKPHSDFDPSSAPPWSGSSVDVAREVIRQNPPGPPEPPPLRQPAVLDAALTSNNPPPYSPFTAPVPQTVTTVPSVAVGSYGGYIVRARHR
eukprot:Sspe_Gene.6874::Locus_2312_Transcript_1_2_Confidence_1.000_Length_1813::g.6874::m.6874